MEHYCQTHYQLPHHLQKVFLRTYHGLHEQLLEEMAEQPLHQLLEHPMESNQMSAEGYSVPLTIVIATPLPSMTVEPSMTPRDYKYPKPQHIQNSGYTTQVVNWKQQHEHKRKGTYIQVLFGALFTSTLSSSTSRRRLREGPESLDARVGSTSIVQGIKGRSTSSTKAESDSKAKM